MRRAVFFAFLALACTFPARADETFDSAKWLLQKATIPHRDGRHNVLLRALRQLRDPELKPFFESLVRHEQPAMKFHGVLGLAEVSTAKKIDLGLVADLKDPLTQAQIIGGAVEADLMDLDQCRQILSSPGYDPAVRIVVATKLVSAGQLKDLTPVAEAEKSDKAAMRGMLAMLRMQLGDAKAIAALREIDAGAERNKDEVRGMLLQTAMGAKLSAIGPWAMEIAQREGEEKGLLFLGLRLAMQFKVPGAVELWSKKLAASEGDAADRIRLALLVVDIAEDLPPATFDPLTKDQDALIAQLGRAGRAVASQQAPEQELTKLLELNHGLSSQWVLGYSQRMPVEQARTVLVGVILAAESTGTNARLKAQRIENCVFASQFIFEKDSAAHGAVISILKDASGLTQEAILMGLLKSNLDAPHKLIEGLTFKTDIGQSLALLIRARHGAKLDETQMKALSLMVRGGAGLQEPLRIQAGWVYLKRTNQAAEALAGLGK